jgi:AraC-like DNA-binding protein
MPALPDPLDARDTPSGARAGVLRLAARQSATVRTTSTAVLICLDGVGTLDESDGTFLVKPGFMAVRPDAWRATITAGPAAMRLVLFSWSPRALAALGPTQLGVAERRTMYGRGSVEIAWRAAGEIQLDDPYTAHALDFYAKAVALSLTRFAVHGARGIEPPRAAQARRLIERHLAKPLDLAALARSVRCDPAYLSRLFRKTYGVSPTEYLLRRRVERARHLLTRSARPIAEIAQELGFHDASHFARHFRHFAGVSPTQFRRRQGERT